MAFSGIEWIIVIVAIVLLLFGANNIPEFARNLGKARAEFSRGQMMVEREIKETEKADREKAEREAKEKAAMEDDAEEDKLDEREGDEDLHKAARNLGIDPKGKTDEELKILIKHKLDEG